MLREITEQYANPLLESTIDEVGKIINGVVIANTRKSKNGYEYSVILKKPHNKKHYLYAYLTKKFYERGTILSAKITQQYDYADIKPKKIDRIIPDLMHIRKLPLMGRKY